MLLGVVFVVVALVGIVNLFAGVVLVIVALPYHDRRRQNY